MEFSGARQCLLCGMRLRKGSHRLTDAKILLFLSFNDIHDGPESHQPTQLVIEFFLPVDPSTAN
jgi:hypothetical protein